MVWIRGSLGRTVVYWGLVGDDLIAVIKTERLCLRIVMRANFKVKLQGRRQLNRVIKFVAKSGTNLCVIGWISFLGFRTRRVPTNGTLWLGLRCLSVCLFVRLSVARLYRTVIARQKIFSQVTVNWLQTYNANKNVLQIKNTKKTFLSNLRLLCIDWPCLKIISKQLYLDICMYFIVRLHNKRAL